MGNDVPFVNYTNSIVYYSEISNASRGATRPTWELLYSHYVQIKGLDAPWTTEYLNYTLSGYGGFEPGAGSLGEGSGHYDGLGWGSLLYHMDADDVTAYLSTLSSSSSNGTSETVSTEVASSSSLPEVASYVSSALATTVVASSTADVTSASASASSTAESGRQQSHASHGQGGRFKGLFE